MFLIFAIETYFWSFKKGAKHFRGKILKIAFLGVFWPKFNHFGPNILISAYFSQTLLWMFLIFAIETYFLVFLKMAQNIFWEKFSNLTFCAFFDQNFTIWTKYAHFSLFLPSATINVPHFRHRNIFFDILKKLLVFTWDILSWVFFLHFHLFWCPLWPNMALFRYPCCAKITQNQHFVYFFT